MIRDVIFTITDMIQQGIISLQPVVSRIMYLLLTIDISLFGIAVATGKKSSLANVIEKLMITGFSIFLITNFPKLAYWFQNWVVTNAGSIGGNFNIDFLLDPGEILQYANEEVLDPLNKLIENSTGFFSGVELKVTFAIAWIGVMLSFLIITIQLSLAIVEFHFVILGSLLILPFTILEPTQFIGTKVFPATIGHAVKLGIISAVASIGMNVYKSVIHLDRLDKITLDYVVMLIFLSLFMAFLCVQIPAIANSLLSGIPNMSASGLIQNMSSALKMVKDAKKTVAGAGKSTANFGAGMARGFQGSSVRGSNSVAEAVGRGVGNVVRGGAGAFKDVMTQEHGSMRAKQLMNAHEKINNTNSARKTAHATQQKTTPKNIESNKNSNKSGNINSRFDTKKGNVSNEKT